MRKIAVEILLGLEEAGNAGLTHSNLTPSNVFLSSEGVRVLGLGLAGWDPEVISNADYKLPCKAMPQYMSPEQLSGSLIDPRSDLFSLAVIMYRYVAPACSARTLCCASHESSARCTGTCLEGIKHSARSRRAIVLLCKENSRKRVRPRKAFDTGCLLQVHRRRAALRWTRLCHHRAGRHNISMPRCAGKITYSCVGHAGTCDYHSSGQVASRQVSQCPCHA